MPTRILSFQQWVLEADPYWQRDMLRPWVYEFSNGRLFYFNPNVYTFGDTGFLNDGGVLVLTQTAGYPISPTGLPAGAVWNNGLTVGVVPGVTPNPSAPPLFFGTVTAQQLLATGGGNLPLSPSGLPTLQLWNNGGLISIK